MANVLTENSSTLTKYVYFHCRYDSPELTFFLTCVSQLKQFDVGDVESLVGRYSHVEHGIKMDGQAFLRQFFNERSLHKRLAMIRQARKGGAVTPEAYIQLQPFILKGQVTVKTYCQVNCMDVKTGVRLYCNEWERAMGIRKVRKPLVVWKLCKF